MGYCSCQLLDDPVIVVAMSKSVEDAVTQLEELTLGRSGLAR